MERCLLDQDFKMIIINNSKNYLVEYFITESESRITPKIGYNAPCGKGEAWWDTRKSKTNCLFHFYFTF